MNLDLPAAPAMAFNPLPAGSMPVPMQALSTAPVLVRAMPPTPPKARPVPAAPAFPRQQPQLTAA
eukprot:15210917-Heterocapsa_arctica.AAC.1